jgi:hypothetical protein
MRQESMSMVYSRIRPITRASIRYWSGANIESFSASIPDHAQYNGSWRDSAITCRRLRQAPCWSAYELCCKEQGRG